MIKLNDEQRKEIISLCKIDSSKQNIKKVATDFDITPRYIYKLLKSDTAKEIEQSINENKSEFSKRANEIIKKALDRLEYMIENDDRATISQVSTAIGILYDKSRLEQNLSTSNNEVIVSIKVE